MFRTFHDRIELNPHSSLRDTIFDNRVFTNTAFRSCYPHVARFVAAYAKQEGITQVVEMGAGTAPLTQCLAELPEARGLTITPCDRTPHVPHYNWLAQQYSNVRPLTTSVDFTQAQEFGPACLLVLLGTFPAVPAELRQECLRNLTRCSKRVIVWEYVRKTPLSMFLAALTFFVGILLPLAYLRKPGRLRRFFRCWLVPVVPCIAAIDGVAWCLRTWSDRQWRDALREVVPPERTPVVESWTNSQRVIW